MRAGALTDWPKTIVLTTYRRDGTPVATPVSLAVDRNRAFFRTWETAWKAKRIRRNPNVQIAPATFWGTPTDPAIPARARFLEGDDALRAKDALARRQPLLHAVLVPLLHRLMGYRTVHLELLPTG